MEKFGKRTRSSNDEIARPFQKVRKREEVDLQWARAAVSAGLPMSFFDNPEVRKVVVVSPQGRTALMWLALKVVLLPCSVSAFEHRWSIEGWIHSNRRNRLGQKLVERLVRTHTNLKLEQRLEMYEAGLLPWDIEMTVEEPVSKAYYQA